MPNNNQTVTTPLPLTTVCDVTNMTISQSLMDANTASEQEATRPAATTSNEETTQKRISEFNVPSFRVLGKICKARVRAFENKRMLDLALEENRIPKGLIPTKIPLKLPDVPTN